MSDERVYVESVRLPGRTEADLTEIAMQTAGLRAERIHELEAELRAIWKALGPDLETTIFDALLAEWPAFLKDAPPEHVAQATAGARRTSAAEAVAIRRAVHAAIDSARAATPVSDDTEPPVTPEGGEL